MACNDLDHLVDTDVEEVLHLAILEGDDVPLVVGPLVDEAILGSGAFVQVVELQ